MAEFVVNHPIFGVALISAISVGIIIWYLRGQYAKLVGKVDYLSDKFDNPQTGVFKRINSLEEQFRDHDKRVDKMQDSVSRIEGYIEANKEMGK